MIVAASVIAAASSSYAVAALFARGHLVISTEAKSGVPGELARWGGKRSGETPAFRPATLPGGPR